MDAMPIPEQRLRSRATRFGLALAIALPLLTRDAHAGWGPIAPPPPATETTAAPSAPAQEVRGTIESAPPPAPVVTAMPPAETPAGVLSTADAALDVGDLDRARALFGKLIQTYPTSTAAGEARRALKVLNRAQARPAWAAAPTDSETPTTTPPVVMRQEPYSTRTSERLRLTTWEKLDFGITAFLYGMSVGTSFAVAQDQSSPDVTGPLALGALAYTVGAVGYLNLANPDRGDLPLALGITSYVPTTVLLLATVAEPNARSSRIAWEVAGAGLLSVPLAIAVTRSVDLDPGDTQLVRDAGFWGLVLATTGTLAFGGDTVNYSGGYTSYSTPSNRQIASAGLLGLFGGLGLGVLTASQTEISLERVRVTTWGGYGGALLGALLGESSNGKEKDTWAGLTIGALVGLTVTFVSTGSLDGIPPENSRLTAMNWSPTLVPLRDASGHTATALGFTGALP